MTQSKNPPTNHFPSRLHDMLDEADERKHNHIISWCPDGRSFRIHLPGEMVTILTRYFRQTKYKSLLRQLQGYDFKRVTSGNDKGNVSHPMFIRGQRHLSMKMKRKTNKMSNNNKTTEVPSSKKTKTKKDKSPENVTSTGAPLLTPLQPALVSSSDCVIPTTVESSTSISKSQLKQLEHNFKYSMKKSGVSGKNQHKVTTLLPTAPTLSSQIKTKQLLNNAATDALRVEIGCTFSSPEDGADRSVFTGMKRKHGSVQTSASAPTLDSQRFPKRQRSYQHVGVDPLRRAFKSEDLSSDFKNAQSSFKNASFSFSKAPHNAPQAFCNILEQEKLEFQKKQQALKKAKEFEQLEKLCFSNVSRPGTDNFQHSFRSTSAVGTMDLNVSLTTTTTTTDENGESHSSSSTFSNKFILEPTPILSPKKEANKSDGVTLNCDINFPSAPCTEQVVLNFQPAPVNSQAITPLEGNSIHSQTEVSDEIDEGIAEAFEDDVDDGWAYSLESDIEDDKDDSNKEEEDPDAWTKNIVYDGKTDCVLEPEKFQMELQTMLSAHMKAKYVPQKLPQPVLSHTSIAPQHLPPQNNVFVQQFQLQAQQPRTIAIQQLQQAPPRIPMPIRRASAPTFPTRRIPIGGAPYALLSRPMAFRGAFPSEIQQIKR